MPQTEYKYEMRINRSAKSADGVRSAGESNAVGPRGDLMRCREPERHLVHLVLDILGGPGEDDGAVLDHLVDLLAPVVVGWVEVKPFQVRDLDS